MISDNNQNKNLKQIKAAEAAAKEAALKTKCEAIAKERYGEDVEKWQKTYGGMWFLPVIDENENIEKLGILKPISRHILSHASTKIEDEGLYMFLEACMRECWIDGDTELLDEDEYFIPAAMKFNKIMESKKVAFLKK